MSKPITVALLLSAAIHIVVGMSLAGSSVRRPPIPAASAARHFAVDLFRQAVPTPAEPKEVKKVVSTVAPSEVKHLAPAPVPPEQVKPVKKEPVKQEEVAREEHVQEPDKELERKLVKKTELPKRNQESVEDLPQITGRSINGSDVEANNPQPKQSGGGSEYHLIQEPNLASEPTPLRYPFRARRMGQEGIVILDVKLDTRGSIVSMTVEKTSGYKILDKAALTAVRRWRFLPLMENGQAMRSQVRIPVRFKLG
ncbi:energy transducer TonB [Sansalvadorimonas sp. 2012CJ34-2]|uniref:Energy transducer TonB n=1 Tax=Parendozoicomonas callyspongiae TaxID=2942213 RepID=A0ABT0PG08_9GAMM|nr:energy transducer TonB [Sansalvadorimonas sp. 2012CJ34-2]MCL6270302.1 energy transducer TonB [Sansalvadorimonas sp. 2012CJ34-2]